jgi:hypothetical protein
MKKKTKKPKSELLTRYTFAPPTKKAPAVIVKTEKVTRESLQR